jgi:DNA-binding FrmR family transcriptional regulator
MPGTGQHACHTLGIADNPVWGSAAEPARQDVYYCIDVLTQVAAATRALQAVAPGLLEDHLGHCVTSAIEQGGPDAQARVREAAEAISRLVRS